MHSKLLRTAFLDTVPVLTGYVFLGFGFGILALQNGLSIWWALAMSLFIYAGSMQFVAVTMLSGDTGLLAAALTTLAVNARHLFYGISMIDRYKGTGKKKPYLIFSLTDETYSLVSQKEPGQDGGKYYLLVSALDQAYWVLGTLLGAAVGKFVPLNYEGIDFVLTALFVTIFVEQWLSTKNHLPACIGLAASVVCRILFGSSAFLIPSMGLIALLLLLTRGKEAKA